jgi:hypothetical protein
MTWKMRLPRFRRDDRPTLRMTCESLLDIVLSAEGVFLCFCAERFFVEKLMCPADAIWQTMGVSDNRW